MGRLQAFAKSQKTWAPPHTPAMVVTSGSKTKIASDDEQCDAQQQKAVLDVVDRSKNPLDDVDEVEKLPPFKKKTPKPPATAPPRWLLHPTEDIEIDAMKDAYDLSAAAEKMMETDEPPSGTLNLPVRYARAADMAADSVKEAVALIEGRNDRRSDTNPKARDVMMMDLINCAVNNAKVLGEATVRARHAVELARNGTRATMLQYAERNDSLRKARDAAMTFAEEAVESLELKRKMKPAPQCSSSWH